MAIHLDEYAIGDKYKKYRAFREDILPFIGADAISASTVAMEKEIPLQTTLFTDTDPADIAAMNVIYCGVEPSFFNTLGIKFTRGSTFQGPNSGDGIPTIITQGVADQLKLGDAIGSRMLFWDSDLHVVGVIDDINIYNLDTDPRPVIFLPIDDLRVLQNEVKTVYINLADKAHEILPRIEEAWTRHISDHFPLEYASLGTSYQATYQTIEDQRVLFIVAMLFILFLSLVGLYAFVAFSVEMREKEIAIKISLGISRKQLFFELARPFIRIIVLGCVLSIFPAYYLVTYWVSNLHYHMDISAEDFVVAYLFLTAVSVLLLAYRIRFDSIQRNTVL